MVRATAFATSTERQRLKALAFRALGLVLGAAPPDAAAFEHAAACLDALEWSDAAAALRRGTAAIAAAPDDARAQHSRIFHRSLPPPYETTYTSGGNVTDLADIAGFYRAFGMSVEGEKPDHVGAELEFLAYLLAKEVHASASDAPERLEICRDARAKFLSGHAGAWLPLFAAQIERASPGAAYLEAVRAAHLAVAADARDMGIALPDPVPYAPVGMPGPPASVDRPYCEPLDSEDAEASAWVE